MTSQKGISRIFELIIARAVVDASFRERLLGDKNSVISEYQLTDEDIDAIKRIDRPTLDKAREIAAMIGVVHLKSSE